VEVEFGFYGTGTEHAAGAAAPVVSAHARACELRHSLTPANEPYAEVRTRSSARLLLRQHASEVTWILVVSRGVSNP